ncbi:hypothetical protein U9M48_017894 [Paspalum notatum var. saurae]|uniref:Uncharacterized protein n=1 Tax=Paspalum notatum var. saurae TaxID=547442 RepID=A0AAQ3WPC1_PASNO
MGALDLHHELAFTQQGQAKLNVEECAKGSLLSDGNYNTEKIDGSNHDDSEKFERGIMQYGCPHYRRRCRIRAPCCNEIFDCRHCHNETKNSIKVDAMRRHELPRHEVQQVICSLCGTEQEVHDRYASIAVSAWGSTSADCANSLTMMLVSKQQYHCNGCGICRIGGRENFFHCSKCGCCYSTALRNSHACVEGALHHDCPICFEYLFESTNDVSVLPCGHTIHVECLKEMEEHCQFACPLCSKSVCDMSKAWERLDMELATLTDSSDDKMCNDVEWYGGTVEVCYSKCALARPHIMQRLWGSIRCAIPFDRAQVPELQVIQHPSDLKPRNSCWIVTLEVVDEMSVQDCHWESIRSGSPTQRGTQEPASTYARAHLHPCRRLGLCSEPRRHQPPPAGPARVARGSGGSGASAWPHTGSAQRCGGRGASARPRAGLARGTWGSGGRRRRTGLTQAARGSGGRGGSAESGDIGQGRRLLGEAGDGTELCAGAELSGGRREGAGR